MQDRLITRAEAVTLIRDEIGLPIGLSSFQCGDKKLFSCDEVAISPIAPPEPVARYGPTFLYRTAEVRDWGERLLKRDVTVTRGRELV
jgi:hypothetical protein